MTGIISHTEPSRGRSIRSGFLGFIIFNSIYISILILASRVSGSLENLVRLWPWGLVVGSLFGVQIGLYAYVRQVITSRKTGFGKIMAVSGTGSIGSMVACCTHLLALFIPFLGVSFLMGFLAQIQESLIYLAIFINLFAIVTQLIMMKNHGIYPSEGGLAKTGVDKLKTIRIFVLAAAVPVLVLSFSSSLDSLPHNRHTSTQTVFKAGDFGPWSEISDTRNGVTVSIKPLLEEADVRLGFIVTLETNTVDLNFDVEHIATLTIDKSVTVTPRYWEGPGPGGHHVSGTLWFPGIPVAPESLQLNLDGIAGLDRVFEWN